MAPLLHILTWVDNTAAMGWSKCGSVFTSTATRPLLREISLLSRHFHVHMSIRHIAGEDNCVADADSLLTHFIGSAFLTHFCLNLPQPIPWRLLLLPSKCRRKLTSMLHGK